MNKKIKYTAFIDVLGFGKYIEKNITNDEKAEQFYDNLHLITQYLEYLKNDTYEKLDIVFLNDIDIKYTWVSDTFVLTIEYDNEKLEDSILSTMIYLLSLAITSIHHFFAQKYGFLIRGGISSKYTFINDNILLGAGIVEAHYLESKIASNARVIFADGILTDEILERLSLLHNDNNLNIISKDCDGYYFINYIGMLQDIPPMIGNRVAPLLGEKLKEREIKDKIEALKEYRKIIQAGLQITDVDVQLKYIWLEEYIDKVMSTGMFGYNIIGNQDRD